MTTDTDTLADKIRTLLMHHIPTHAPIRPDVMVIRNQHGAYGVAVVVDGWYTAAGDAASVAGHWQELLHNVTAEL